MEKLELSKQNHGNHQLNSRQIVQKIKEGIKLGERKHEPRESTDFHAREVGGCLLRAALRRAGTPEDESPGHRGVDLAERGNYLERFTTGALSRTTSFSGSQTRTSKTYTSGAGDTCVVTGRADGFLSSTEGIELKSIGDKEYRELRSIAILRATRISHVLQALTYCWLFDLKTVFLVYCNRNDADYRAFPIHRDDKALHSHLEALIDAEKEIKEGNLPNPKPSYACYYCPFIKLCPAWNNPPQEEAPT